MEKNRISSIAISESALRNLESFRALSSEATSALTLARREAERMRQFTRELERVNSLANIQPLFKRFEATTSVLRTSFPGSGWSAFQGVIRDVLEKPSALAEIGRMQNAGLAFRPPYWMEMNRSVKLSLTALERIPLESIGRAIDLHECARQEMTERFMGASDSLWGYHADLALGTEELSEMPADLRRLPLSGYLEEARFLRTISTEEVPRDDIREPQRLSGPLPRIEKKVVTILRQVNPSLLTFWEEAGIVASSDSRAKGKSVCVYLRTVLQHLLTTWAPAQEAYQICGHHDDITDEKGKGSRLKAQVRYLGGGIPNAHSQALEEQVSLVMSALNEGDHGVESALALKSRDLYALMGLVGQSIVTLSVLHTALHQQGKQ